MKRTMGFLVIALMIGGAVWVGLTSSGLSQLPLSLSPAPSSQPVGNSRFKVWLNSGQAEVGVTYVYETGHCGLTYLLDFDGSFWDAINPRAPREAPSFFINYDSGTIELTSNDVASYTASTGKVIRLERADGPVTIGGCA